MSAGPPPNRDGVSSRPSPPSHSSSHRRRHSLPPANKLASILSFWSGNNSSADSLHQTSERLSRPSTNNQNGTSPSKPPRRRRGSRSKSTTKKPLTQPVLVRAYSPRPESRTALHSNNSHPTIPEADEPVPLPAIDSFSFTSILKAVDPKVSRTLETISHLSTTYRSNLQHETNLLITHQRAIETRIVNADQLSSQILSTTTSRTDRLKHDFSHAFRNGLAVEELASSAEQAYACIEDIISKLEAIDELLPVQDRLGRVDSPHRRHYPYTHSLLVAKSGAGGTMGMIQTGEVRKAGTVGMSSLLSPRVVNVSGMSSVHTGVEGTDNDASSAAAGQGSTSSIVPSGTGSSSNNWLRRRSGTGGSQLPYLSANGPPMTAEERRMSNPPQLLLRTLHPSAASSLRSGVGGGGGNGGEMATPQVSSPSPYHSRRQSGIITNVPIGMRADNLSVASGGGNSTRSSFSFKNLLWGGGWRRAGSNASVASSGVGSEAGETAEEKLRRIIAEQTRRRLQLDRRGEGLASSLPVGMGGR